MVLELGRRIASQRADHPGDDHDEPVRAGVHDARLAQDGQLFRTALDGLGAGLERALKDVREQ